MSCAKPAIGLINGPGAHRARSLVTPRPELDFHRLQVLRNPEYGLIVDHQSNHDLGEPEFRQANLYHAGGIVSNKCRRGHNLDTSFVRVILPRLPRRGSNGDSYLSWLPD
jgi:hypothetical protein